MNMFESSETERIVAELKRVLADAEDLLKNTADKAGDAVGEARHRTERYVHDNPWQAVGIATAIGVLVGVLLGRSRR
jgi:ElaB/YqjD/DUF883 family membrane-anchored ribosome-binding protein